MMARWTIAVALLIVGCSPIRGCMESEFTLEDSSRLPKWVSLPQGTSRDTVTVRLRYYVPPVPVDNTEIALMRKNGSVISETTGMVCWHPVMKQKKNQFGGFDPDSYPHYVYIRVGSQLDVIEHKRGPQFRVSDDPTLFKAAIEASECDKG
jgi:hypothetical protein